MKSPYLSPQNPNLKRKECVHRNQVMAFLGSEEDLEKFRSTTAESMHPVVQTQTSPTAHRGNGRRK
jgi:hypothetical protein